MSVFRNLLQNKLSLELIIVPKEKYAEFNPDVDWYNWPANANKNLRIAETVSRSYSFIEYFELWLVINGKRKKQLDTSQHLNKILNSLGYEFRAEQTHEIYGTYKGLKSNSIYITQDANHIDEIYFGYGKDTIWKVASNDLTKGYIASKDAYAPLSLLRAKFKSGSNVYTESNSVLRFDDTYTNVELPIKWNDDSVTDTLNVFIKNRSMRFDAVISEDWYTFENNHVELDMLTWDDKATIYLQPNDTGQARTFPESTTYTATVSIYSDKPELQPEITLTCSGSIQNGTQDA